MRRIFLAFMLVGLLAACKDKDTAPGGDEDTSPPVVTPESTVTYFNLSGSYIYRDSLYIYSSDSFSIDTVKRTFFTAVSSTPYLLVPFRDSTYSSGQIKDDTFKISGDTLYLLLKFNMDTVSIGFMLDYLVGIRPLSVGQNWNPIPERVYPLTDSLISPQSGCTLYVYFDSLSVDSSRASVLGMETVTTPYGTFEDSYKVFYSNDLRLFYHTTGCFSLSGAANITMRDTSYFKPYEGLVRSHVFTKMMSLVSTDSSENFRVLVGR
ncbi:MAG: hypothetical protein GXO39_06250 [Thermotogae bacterium]|nr:hypothetical protein [Thermotogota bacterium]